VGGSTRELALRAGSELGRSLFAKLAAETADPPGVNRVAYGDGERIAFALVAQAAQELGARAAFDAAGNQFLTLAGSNSRSVLYIGSHLDSVPHGGNYDGAAGVLLGLALQAAVVEHGLTLPFDLCVLCLRAEESCWFPHSYIGSKTALGLLEPALLDTLRRSDSGRTLADHMQEEGFEPNKVRSGVHRIDRHSAIGYIEPHIEQGPVLVAENEPLALVTAIRGSFRYRTAHCYGTYTHSGATPLSLRQDAVVATAELVAAMQVLYEKKTEMGDDLTVTFGILGTDPARHAFSAVAGETTFSVDVRSQSVATLDAVEARFKEIAETIAAKRKVQFELGTRTVSNPAVMSAMLNQRLQQAASAAFGHALPRMASGAGHDAATFAAAGIPSTMIFIRNANGSHNPEEAMDMSDFDKALALLFTLVEGARGDWS
jgi:N-carbamoyl-L-amino-acid hydrolase